MQKRGENTWRLHIFVGRHPVSKKPIYQSRTFHRPKKEADRLLRELVRDYELGRVSEPSRQSLGQFLEEWLDKSARQKVRARTLQDYRKLLRTYIQDTLGFVPLGKVTPMQIQSLYSALSDGASPGAGVAARDPLSPRTIRNLHFTHKQALQQAVRWRLIPHNPAVDVELPRAKTRHDRHVLRPLTPSQVRLFLKAVEGDRFKVLFHLLLGTGMRPGEALGLKWSCVDFQYGAIRVEQALVRVFGTGGGWRLEEPKTAKSRRTIPIPPELASLLEQHREKQAVEKQFAGARWQEHDFVFAANQGQPLHELNIVKRHFKPALVKAGLPSYIRLYDIRHTHATALLLMGESEKVISERLGHSTTVLTMDTYCAVLPTMQKAAAAKVGSFLYG
ncbi:MAG: tyrosine-type recombinase/integrase [Vulcanimicrobiota bacterium]